MALALYLVALCALGVGAETWVEALDSGLYVLTTAALASFALARGKPRRDDTRWGVWLLCAASSLYFLAYDASTPSWVIFLRLLGDGALLQLGRSFAVLPAMRSIKTAGLYRLIRHPAYASYLALDLVIVLSSPSLRNALVAALGGATLVARARLEEHLLEHDTAYRNYQRQTPYRFLPGIY